MGIGQLCIGITQSDNRAAINGEANAVNVDVVEQRAANKVSVLIEQVVESRRFVSLTAQQEVLVEEHMEV